jgi:hypothetical protein
MQGYDHRNVAGLRILAFADYRDALAARQTPVK